MIGLAKRSQANSHGVIMNSRIQSLMAALQRDRHPICIEKLRIALRTMALTEGEPMILRRAKVFANVLREIPIFIEENTLIVGNGASKPMGLEIDPEYFAWSQDEIDALKKEGFVISPEEERELQELNGSRKSKTLIGSMGEVAAYDERLLTFLRMGIILPPWKSAAEGSGGGYAQSGLGLGPGFFLMALLMQLQPTSMGSGLLPPMNCQPRLEARTKRLQYPLLRINPEAH
jgi:hypothetical protein